MDKDNWETPESAVNLILPYVLNFKTIWCPFDTEDSNFVKIFKENGINVINSHISSGEDFFTFEPSNYDAIISNPPFSKIDYIIKRLYKLDKPYAIIIPLYAIAGNTKFNYIKDSAQILIPENRIQYINPDTKEVVPAVSFASCYLCKDILPERLIYVNYLGQST